MASPYCCVLISIYLSSSSPITIIVHFSFFQVRTVVEKVKVPSFFHFFSPPDVDKLQGCEDPDEAQELMHQFNLVRQSLLLKAPSCNNNASCCCCRSSSVVLRPLFSVHVCVP
jgi:hypothetical protein